MGRGMIRCRAAHLPGNLRKKMMFLCSHHFHLVPSFCCWIFHLLASVYMRFLPPLGAGRSGMAVGRRNGEVGERERERDDLKERRFFRREGIILRLEKSFPALGQLTESWYLPIWLD